MTIDEVLENVECPYKDGDMLFGTIEGDTISRMQLHVEEDRIYVLQNEKDGACASDKRGFRYSWFICDYSGNFNAGCIKNSVKILGKFEEKEIKHNLPKYFYVLKSQEILDKLIELFPDSNVEYQAKNYGTRVEYPYVGVSLSFPRFEINYKDAFEDDDDECILITQAEFWEAVKPKEPEKTEYELAAEKAGIVHKEGLVGRTYSTLEETPTLVEFPTFVRDTLDDVKPLLIKLPQSPIPVGLSAITGNKKSITKLF